MKLMKLLYTLALGSSLSLSACAHTPGTKPSDGDPNFPNHPNTGERHDAKNVDKYAPFRITMTSDGRMVVLNEKGEEMRPNAKLPLKVVAHYIESAESTMIMRYRGSPEYYVLEVGGDIYHVPIPHTH
ncbi:hypothetical protein HCH_04643 [Hahella chejuensis KCTC 2396]|uniref:Uncharacterized protein n=1 Tax=Hahella chejuensis (strain KCTC 2396) TaxID=349521 RepID=Q2SDD2_HAHCH|nr:hypothetical protein [Hahella chejuensis]ABC31342.1 hypothetical protein HCH_04643 [Hahella chejuensis KCTC 2396]